MTTTISPLERPARPETQERFDEFTTKQVPWWAPWLPALTVLAVIVGVGSYLVYGRGYFVPSMMRGSKAVPPVSGYYNGERITFIHTEASDPRWRPSSAG